MSSHRQAFFYCQRNGLLYEEMNAVAAGEFHFVTVSEWRQADVDQIKVQCLEHRPVIGVGLGASALLAEGGSPVHEGVAESYELYVVENSQVGQVALGYVPATDDACSKRPHAPASP
jgi:hypothetical protein